MKAVFLDVESLDQHDLDLSPLTTAFDALSLYSATSSDQVLQRVQDADVIITNKVHNPATTTFWNVCFSNLSFSRYKYLSAVSPTYKTSAPKPYLGRKSSIIAFCKSLCSPAENVNCPPDGSVTSTFEICLSLFSF